MESYGLCGSAFAPGFLPRLAVFLPPVSLGSAREPARQVTPGEDRLSSRPPSVYRRKLDRAHAPTPMVGGRLLRPLPNRPLGLWSEAGRFSCGLVRSKGWSRSEADSGSASSASVSREGVAPRRELVRRRSPDRCVRSVPSYCRSRGRNGALGCAAATASTRQPSTSPLLARACAPRWMQGWEGDRLLPEHTQTPDPTRSRASLPAPGGRGWHPPRARSRAESHRGRRRPQPR